MITAGEDGYIRFYAQSNGVHLGKIEIGSQGISAVESFIDKNQHFIVSGTYEGTILIHHKVNNKWKKI